MATASANGRPGARRLALGTCFGLATLAALGCRQTVTFEHADASSLGSGGPGGSPGLGGSGGIGYCPSGGEPHFIGSHPEVPLVIAAVDRSSAMQQDAFGSDTKLEATRNALLAIANKNKYKVSVRFGYVGFPGRAPTGSCMNSECCSYIETTVPPPPHSDPPTTMPFSEALLGCNDPKSMCIQGVQRPTGAALANVLAWFTGFPGSSDQSSHRYVILITDNSPGCVGSAADACMDAGRQVMMLANLQPSVVTFIAGLGLPANDTCLPTLAGNGFFRLIAPGQLDSILGDIVDKIAHDACYLDLEKFSADPTKVYVYQSGVGILPKAGWDYAHTTLPIVILHDPYCNTMLESGGDGPNNSHLTTLIYSCS